MEDKPTLHPIVIINNTNYHNQTTKLTFIGLAQVVCLELLHPLFNILQLKFN